jgi:hypothetical protein
MSAAFYFSHRPFREILAQNTHDHLSKDTYASTREKEYQSAGVVIRRKNSATIKSDGTSP